MYSEFPITIIKKTIKEVLLSVLCVPLIDVTLPPGVCPPSIRPLGISPTPTAWTTTDELQGKLQYYIDNGIYQDLR